jgi:predicted Fe-Mo cluster-binding NifX family protein
MIQMKIAVPSADDTGLQAMISEHFGRSPYFTIVDTDGAPLEIVSNMSPNHGPSAGSGQHDHEHHHDGSGHHGHGYAFRSLSEKEVDILVCRGLGMRAMQLFREKGIRIYCGAEGTVQDAVLSFKEGKLSEAGPEHACHHGHHH